MEIKLNFQTLLNLVHFVEGMQLETVALLAVTTLLTPFVIGSLWHLVVAILCQLFWLGVTAGCILFLVSVAIFVFLKMTYGKPGKQGRTFKIPCTLMDVLLSLVYQTGLWIPTPLWDRLVSSHSKADRKADLRGYFRIIKEFYPEIPVTPPLAADGKVRRRRTIRHHE